MPGDSFQTKTAEDRAGLLEVNRKNVEFTYTQALHNDLEGAATWRARNLKRPV